MRPRKLELEGFASFRERVEIDFDGVELFALTGATGAGKSSILDAIVFCLFGTVPRLDDRRAVAPIITQGKAEAKVRLDFTVGNESYTAVRVVRRLGSGASTKEARLEKDGQVIAPTADDVSTKAEEILGLNFDQYTKCVMLPQGDFARFLHDKGKDKNDLLRKLLAVDLFQKLKDLAGQEETRVEGQRRQIEGQLLGYRDDTPENLASLREQAKAFEMLLAEVDAALPAIEAARQDEASARNRAKECSTDSAAIAAIKAPEGLDALGERAEQLEREAEEAAKSVLAAGEQVHASEQALSALPQEREVEAQLRVWADSAKQNSKLATLNQEVAGLVKQESEARDATSRAEKALQEAVEALEAAQVGFEAQHLAQKLATGDPCPVCGGRFEHFPGVPSEKLEVVEQRRRECQTAHEQARRSLGQVEATLSVRREAADGLQKEVETLNAQLQNMRHEEELKALLVQVTAAGATLREAQARFAAAVAAERKVKAGLDEAKTQQKEVWTTLDAALRTVAALQPPLLERNSPAQAWSQFQTWAREKSTQLQAEAKRSQEQAEESAARRASLEKALLGRVNEAGLEVPPGASIRDAVLAATTSAGDRCKSCERRIEEAKTLRAEEAAVAKRQKVLSTLKNHLQTNRFESWYLNRAFKQLCQAASETLKELSSGQYSLSVDEKNEFQIVDHSNADEQRSVKTLSGGETFLASLALALSLAEQVAMRAGSAAKLESLFLDEGFGTLDPETLEIVAGAIEELGSKGRMIGVITHVREFADRLPVRFEVKKGARGSTVEKVTA